MTHTTTLTWLIAGCLSSTAAAQTTWYVDVHATAPGDGSPQAPFTALADAVTAAEHDDTILVLPGVYPGSEIVVDQRITIRSTGGPHVTSIPPVALVPTEVLGADGALTGFTVRGGVRTSFLSEVTIRRCVIVSQGLPGDVGVRLGQDSLCVVRQSVVSGFESAFAGGFGCAPQVTNTILHDNLSVFSTASGSSGQSFFRYCAGLSSQLPWWLGSNNLIGDPGLWSPIDGDFRLVPGSVCIDAGDPSFPTDPDGSRSDIGAFVYDASYAHPATNYCMAQVNSAGCTPQISAVGSASASSPQPFVVTCSNVLNERSGLAFYGFAPREAHPFHGGFLCVQGPLCRTPALWSGGAGSSNPCAGLFALDFNALIRSGSDVLLEPGKVVYTQFWSRDSAAAHGTNLSAGLRFGIGL